MRFDKTLSFCGWSIRLHRRSSDSFMGRFGAAWNWKIGVQWSARCVLVSLLVMEIGISRKSKQPPVEFKFDCRSLEWKKTESKLMCGGKSDE